METKHVTISLPVELHSEARFKKINVSLACSQGLRIALGLNCPIKTPCICSKKAEKLQHLLLKSHDELEIWEKNYRRLRDYVAKLEEKG